MPVHQIADVKQFMQIRPLGLLANREHRNLIIKVDTHSL